NLSPLKFRKIRRDLITLYDILNDNLNSNLYSDLKLRTDSITRGHDKKLERNKVRTSMSKYALVIRIMPIWNSLTQKIVGSKSVN
ncbi:hypothetical protein HELRODRAFT_144487, partial [Helobdella robusta]|uniref:Uncharacterized protein n=1 Tax=Helobdella robusta TaxID=6412 RepID=T1EJF1_HELRO